MKQSARAYEQLRGEIVEWELAPGTHLSEVRLSERLGVSRTPLREALQELGREGLVRITPGRGAIVSEVALQDVVHLFQAREAVEPYVSRLCARQADRSRFATLQRELEARRAELEAGGPPAGDYGEYYALIARLDTAMDETSGNPYLSSALTSLRGQLHRLRQIAKRKPTRMLQTTSEHVAICAAICEGNETVAAQATAVHINNSLRNILAVMAEGVAGPAFGAVLPTAPAADALTSAPSLEGEQ